MRDLRFDEAPQAGFHPNHWRLGHFRSGPGTKRGGGHSLTGSFSQFCSKVTHPGKHSMLSQNYRNTKIRDTQPVSQVARLLFRFALLGNCDLPRPQLAPICGVVKIPWLETDTLPPSENATFFALPRLWLYCMWCMSVWLVWGSVQSMKVQIGLAWPWSDCPRSPSKLVTNRSDIPQPRKGSSVSGPFLGRIYQQQQLGARKCPEPDSGLNTSICHLRTPLPPPSSLSAFPT